MAHVMKVQLWADGDEVPLNPFLSTLIGNVVQGVVSSLKGIDGAPQRIEFCLHATEVTSLTVNRQPISLHLSSGFAERVIGSTLNGMLLPLKDVGEATDVVIVLSKD